MFRSQWRTRIGSGVVCVLLGSIVAVWSACDSADANEHDGGNGNDGEPYTPHCESEPIQGQRSDYKQAAGVFAGYTLHEPVECRDPCVSRLG
jgi:hypothetical protein